MKSINPKYFARLWAGVGDENGITVNVVPKSRKAPKLNGESFYFTTPSGKTIVRHPSAYDWLTLYHPSTRSVDVGEGWLKRHKGRVHVDASGLRCIYVGKPYKIHGFTVYRAFYPQSARKCFLIFNKKFKNWSCHIDRNNFKLSDAREAVLNAISIRRIQVENAVKLNSNINNLKLLGVDVVVRLQDSVNSGNCQSGTIAWAIQNKFDFNKGASVRDLLKFPSNYVMRACETAIKRHTQNLLVEHAKLT